VDFPHPPLIPLNDNAKNRKFPVVTTLLVVLNATVFGYLLVQGTASDDLIWHFGLIPYRLSRPFYFGWTSWLLGLATLVTSTYIHGGLVHLVGNILFLWVFGDSLENRLGRWRYFAFYLIVTILANLVYVIVMATSRDPTIGASGAVAGILGGYIRLFWKQKVRSLVFVGNFIVVGSLPAILPIGFWAVLQLFNGLVALNPLAAEASSIAYWAHIGGFMSGLAIIYRFLPPKKRTGTPSPA
jgi:membrane associated rhomboid family serine protease